jgi:hypothetical protein
LSQDRTTASENKNYKKLVYLSRMTNNKSAWRIMHVVQTWVNKY